MKNKTKNQDFLCPEKSILSFQITFSMKSKFLSSFVLLNFIVLFTFHSSTADEKGNQANIYKRFTALQCDSLIKANESNPNFVILDVRTPSEWNNYHLLGSVNHSTGSATFDAELAALPKHKLYLLHCQSGGRSAGAFAKMKTLGFAEVYEMIGGLNSWNSAKLPTTTISGPKLMVISVIKNTNNAANDTTQVTVTNRSNGVLSFTNISFTDEHSVQTDFNNLKTLSGAEDYTFNIVHPAGLGDTTLLSLQSNGGNINITIGNSLSTLAISNSITELKLFPNPVSDILFFDAGNVILEKIDITDLTGKIVLTRLSYTNREDVDVSGFKAGIYFARIKTQNRMITRKFVVKH